MALAGRPTGLPALGAVLVLVAGIGYGLWGFRRKRMKEAHDRMTYDIVIDIHGSPERAPWPVEINTVYEPDMEGLGVCVLGDYKVGKTFLINHLCNLNLCSVEAQHTKGLSLKRGRGPRHQVVWIDTAGHGCPCDMRRETVEDRGNTENLLTELAYRLADVRIVVVSNCKLRDQEFIYSLHHQIQTDGQTGKDLLIVVHNYSRIANPNVLVRAFQKDVVVQFRLQEVQIPSRSKDTPQKRLWVDRSDRNLVYHLFLGQEGSYAGDKFNEQTFNAIFDLCVDRLAYSSPHDFIGTVVRLSNEGLLAQYLACHQRVRYDAERCQIMVEEAKPASTTPSFCSSLVEPPPPPVAPSGLYYSFS